LAAAYDYDPYGNLTYTKGIDTPLLYNGQYRGSETGPYYLRARYYDPTTALFLTRDPLSGITQSPYIYANGDPLQYAGPQRTVC
jgi:RHS repeat-associated protein